MAPDQHERKWAVFALEVADQAFVARKQTRDLLHRQRGDTENATGHVPG